jgi:hypothetical protein
MAPGRELRESRQEAAGAVFRGPLADDRNLVAVGGEPYAECLFDGREVLVRDAEQGGEPRIGKSDGLVGV